MSVKRLVNELCKAENTYVYVSLTRLHYITQGAENRNCWQAMKVIPTFTSNVKHETTNFQYLAS